MKQFISLLLVTVMLLCFAACSNAPTSSTAAPPQSTAAPNPGNTTAPTTQAPTTAAPTTAAPTTAAPTVPFEETVLVDDENITFKFTAIDADSLWGYTVKAFLENKTDKELMFSMDKVSVNGFMNEPLWAASVNSGMKSNEDIIFSRDALETCGIKTVTEITFTLRVYDNNDWMADPILEQEFTVYPLGQEAVVPFTRTSVEGEIVLVDDDKCTVIVTGFYEDSIWGYSAQLYLENKTDKILMYSTTGASVNDFMCDPLWAEEVTPGKRSITSMSWSDSALEENGITEVTHLTLPLRVYESGDWISDDLVSETFELYPLGEDAVVPYVRTPVEGEIVLFDNEYCTMIITGFEQDDLWGYTANVYLENKTDKTLMFSLNDAAVNGFMCDPFWASEVAAGKRSNSGISWSESSFESNGITTVESLTLPVRVYDANDWLAADIVNETFTVEP